MINDYTDIKTIYKFVLQIPYVDDRATKTTTATVTKRDAKRREEKMFGQNL